LPPANQTVNVGSDVTLHCVATTDELERHKLKISWLLNGEKIEFGSRTNVAQYDPDKSLKISEAQIDNTGTYTCNASTELDWDAVTVKVTVRGMTFTWETDKIPPWTKRPPDKMSPGQNAPGQNAPCWVL